MQEVLGGNSRGSVLDMLSLKGPLDILQRHRVGRHYVTLEFREEVGVVAINLSIVDKQTTFIAGDGWAHQGNRYRHSRERHRWSPVRPALASAEVQDMRGGGKEAQTHPWRGGEAKGRE